MDILDELLGMEPYITEFNGYEYVPHNLWNIIPLGSYIKYIDRDQEIRNGGFLIQTVNHSCVEQRQYVLKRNNKIFEFRPFFYYIFYKNPNEDTPIETNVVNQPTEPKKKRRKNRKPMKNSELFSKLLDAL